VTLLTPQEPEPALEPVADAPVSLPPVDRFGARDRDLVVVSPTYAPEPLGTPLYSADMVRWLAGIGWNVEVVTGQPFYPQFERYPGYGRRTRHDVVDGVPVHRLPTFVPHGGRTRWRMVTDANFLAQGASRAGGRRLPRARTVLSVSPGSPVAPILASTIRRRGGRHVCLVHDVQSGLAVSLGMVKSSRMGEAIREVERRSLDLADQLLTLSPEMADVLRRMGVRTPIAVLPLWSTVEAPTATIGPVTDIQFSGNFGRKQGLWQLLDLMEGLRAVRPQTTFTLRGAGPMLDAFKDLLATKRLDDVEILPPVDTLALPSALSSSRVHIVPQLAATATHVVPSKIVNALAVGGAVLAFCGPDSPVARMADACDAIRVVEPGQTAAAVAAAVDLLDRRDARELRTAAIDYATQRHGRERLLSRLHDVLVADEPINTFEGD
jgi:colanic acid biosynthesis glycosyl transferase WcaI